MRKGISVFILIVLIILGIFFVLQNNALNYGRSSLKSSSFKTGIGPFSAEQRLEFTSASDTLSEGLTKTTSHVTSPVDADITINAVSRDNVTVTGMWQDGKKTIVVLEPIKNQSN